jgi:DNA-binding Lrp family transcriptional regulator
MHKPSRLDATDIRILGELQRNGRMTNAELAERVSLSQSPCLQRVRRLESAGYIAGYAAQIGLAQFGDAQVVFAQITLSQHRREDFLRFEHEMRKQDRVMEVHLVSGGFDYLVKFVVRNIAAYQALIDSLLERDIGIARYFSFIVLKSPVVKTAYPAKLLEGIM